MKTKILFMAAASSMMLGLTSCSDFSEEENKVGETAGLAYKTPAGPGRPCSKLLHLCPWLVW